MHTSAFRRARRCGDKSRAADVPSSSGTQASRVPTGGIPWGSAPRPFCPFPTAVAPSPAAVPFFLGSQGGRWPVRRRTGKAPCNGDSEAGRGWGSCATLPCPASLSSFLPSGRGCSGANISLPERNWPSARVRCWRYEIRQPAGDLGRGHGQEVQTQSGGRGVGRPGVCPSLKYKPPSLGVAQLHFTRICWHPKRAGGGLCHKGSVIGGSPVLCSRCGSPADDSAHNAGDCAFS